MSLCPRCNEFTFGFRHTCPPQWYILIDGEDAPDEGEDIADYTKAVYAESASAAAEKGVDKWDDGESAHRGATINVTVFNSDGENPQRFEVECGLQTVYHATVLKGEPIP